MSSPVKIPLELAHLEIGLAHLEISPAINSGYLNGFVK